MYQSSAITHRPCGRAHSPPTWAWYEQFQPEDLESGSESGSLNDSEDEIEAVSGINCDEKIRHEDAVHGDVELIHNDTSVTSSEESTELGQTCSEKVVEKDDDKPILTSEMKGKQKAADPCPAKGSDQKEGSSSPRKHGRRRRVAPVYAARPILTIKSSQGFVWNQDLFVPSYIKDRYFVSTSPPTNPTMSMPTLASSADTLNDYEVDVVEIRVTGNELKNLIP